MGEEEQGDEEGEKKKNVGYAESKREGLGDGARMEYRFGVVIGFSLGRATVQYFHFQRMEEKGQCGGDLEKGKGKVDQSRKDA